MNIILGASGQVGSQIVKHLIESKQPVKAIIRDESKADELEKLGTKVFIADGKDVESLTDAFKDGEKVFLLTPENGEENDILGSTQIILTNYRKAIESSSIKKLVGLSSIGAQYASDTGNLLMSYMLEHAFEGLEIEKIFIRPAYYFSNWLPYLNIVKETGVLPTFYPVDLAIPMISPEDVAGYTAEILTNDEPGQNIYELLGPASYSSRDAADAFSQALNMKVEAKQTPRDDWEQTLKSLKFSEDGIKNFIEMTQAVIDGRTQTKNNQAIVFKGKTTLQEFFEKAVKPD